MKGGTTQPASIKVKPGPFLRGQDWTHAASFFRQALRPVFWRAVQMRDCNHDNFGAVDDIDKLVGEPAKRDAANGVTERVPRIRMVCNLAAGEADFIKKLPVQTFDPAGVPRPRGIEF